MFGTDDLFFDVLKGYSIKHDLCPACKGIGSLNYKEVVGAMAAGAMQIVEKGAESDQVDKETYEDLKRKYEVIKQIDATFICSKCFGFRAFPKVQDHGDLINKETREFFGKVFGGTQKSKKEEKEK